MTMTTALRHGVLEALRFIRVMMISATVFTVVPGITVGLVKLVVG